MAVLQPTEITGRVAWLGRVADREVKLASDPVTRVELGFDGIRGEYHSGLVRPSCSRVKAQYPVGTEIRNVRQVSILSSEEMDATAKAMGLDRIAPEWVGASLILTGIPDLTLLPPSSRLIFERGVSLVIDMENAPCVYSGREIDKHHPGVGKLYKPAARNRRGVTAWVEHPGLLEIGDAVRLHAPPQRLYPHLPA